jgi:parvulin-like peptidyl-prolyl isomerase
MAVATGCAAVAAIVLSAVAPGQEPPASTTSPPVARVGDVVISRGDVDAVMRRVNPGTLPKEGERQQLEAAVLEQLIDEHLLRSQLAARLIQVSPTEIDAGLQRIQGQLAARGTTLEAFLAASGRDEQALRDQIELEVGLEKYVRQRMTAEALESLFEEKRREFDGTRLRVSHILFRPVITDADGIARLVKQAEAVRRDVLQGRITFEDAARRDSAAPSRHRGGDIGWIGRDGPMSEVFSKPVFELAKGAVSKPFVSQVGIHVAKVTDVEPGRIGLDAVRPRLEKLLANRLIRELVAKGHEATPVIYVPGVAHFDPATPPDGPQPRRVLVEGQAAAN